MRYEAKIQQRISSLYPDHYVPSPWVEYVVENFIGVCQPDGVLFFPEEGRIIVVEVKISHDPRAWFQLWGLYVPVLKAIFGEELWDYRGVEVCRYYDQDEHFPGEIGWIGDLSQARPEVTNLALWNEKRERPLEVEDG